MLTRPLAGLGVGPSRKGKEGGDRGENERGRERGEGKGGEGVPECPNPGLANSLLDKNISSNFHISSVSSEYRKRTIKYKGIKLWNNFSVDIKETKPCSLLSTKYKNLYYSLGFN